MEVNDFWRTKVHFYFTEILDFDSDGHVSSKDVEAFKDMYKYIKNLDHDSPELEKFSRFLNIWIDNILSMSEKFGEKSHATISIDDFMKYCETIRGELIGRTTWPSSLHYMSDYIEALFNILDIDNDGQISKQDFLSNSASAEDLNSREQSWKYICKNDDSAKLDKKTFDQLCIEFLVSTNPTDPGNWIFGTFHY